MAAVIEESPSKSQRSSSQMAAHVDFLDGMRALAALFVMMSHVWWTVWPRELGKSPTGTMFSLTAWLYYGHFAVAVFIVISGFCLMLPVVRNGALRGGTIGFLRRRARRILPTYYAAMALSGLLIWALVGHKTGTHWDVSIPVTFKGFLVHALLVQNIFPSNEINHAFWSIAVEWQIYFLFPILLIFWKRLGPVATTAGALVLSYLAYVVVGRLHLPVLAPHFLGLFALGMFAATIAQSKPELPIRSAMPWKALSIILSAALVALCFRFGFNKPHTEVMDFLVGFLMVCLLVHASQKNTGKVVRLLSWKPLVGIGGFSYSIYLIHAPLVQIVWQYLVHPLHLSENATFVLTLIACVPVILLCSYGFYLLAERPFVSSNRVRGSS